MTVSIQERERRYRGFNFFDDDNQTSRPAYGLPHGRGAETKSPERGERKWSNGNAGSQPHVASAFRGPFTAEKKHQKRDGTKRQPKEEQNASGPAGQL